MPTATAADAFKLNFFNAIKSQFGSDPDKQNVLVCYGAPGTFDPDDIVSFGGVTSNQGNGPISATNRSREESLSLTVTISCWRGGGQEMELVCAQRAYALLRAIEYYARQTDTTIGNTVRWCFLVQHESSGHTDPSVIEEGRVIEITARFDAQVRITGV